MSDCLKKLINLNNSVENFDQNDVNDTDDLNENNDIPKPKIVRGNLAPLTLSDSDDSSDDGGIFSNNLNNNSKKGIYSMKLNETKKKIIDTHIKLDNVDRNLVLENNKENAKGCALKNVRTKNETCSSDSESDSDSGSSIEQLCDLKYSNGVDKAKVKSNNAKTKKKKLERDDSPTPPSPPPPPSMMPTVNNKKHRRKSTVAEKQLKELESIKNATQMKKKQLEYLDQNSFNDNLNDECNMITVKVSSINGIHKWEIKENDQFKVIFENLAKIEDTDIENIKLTHKDKDICLDDTPKTIGLKIFDIIVCTKIRLNNKTANNERIRIIESEESLSKIASNQITITLQTEEGRKSRVKFLIYKDEKFGNILKKYCEKRELDIDTHIMEFEGDKVNLQECSNDLDLDGEEIIDVRKSGKTTLQCINENKKVYDFDDDILCV